MRLQRAKATTDDKFQPVRSVCFHTARGFRTKETCHVLPKCDADHLVAFTDQLWSSIPVF